MRIKTLLVAAAITAVGYATSLAQTNVYSQNVVGYINLTLTNGMNLIANQLDLDGNGTNNTVYTSIGTNLPNLTRVYAFDPVAGSYPFVTFSTASLVWVGNLAAVNKALQPGGAVFVSIPGTASYPQTVTLVGNVRQSGAGTLTTPIGAYYQLLGSQVPQAGGVQTVLGYTPANLDRGYLWRAAEGVQNWGTPRTYSTATSAWVGGEPSVTVGQGFLMQGHAGSTWSRTFNVQ